MTLSRKSLALLTISLCCALSTAGCATHHTAAVSGRTADYCAEHTASLHPTTADPSLAIRREVDEFKALLAQSLTYRQETVRLAGYLKEKEQQGKPFSGEDIDTLNLGIAAHLQLRKSLYAVAEAHECWLDEGGAKLGSRDRLTGVMLSLSAALTLYDNYLLAISSVDCDPKLRRFVNRPDSGYLKRRSQLDEVTQEFNSISNRQRVRRAMQFYEQAIAQLSPEERRDPAIDYLNGCIQASPSYAMVREYAPVAVLAKKIGFLGEVTTDTIIELQEQGLNLFSMLFGNATGMVATRKGLLHDRPALAERIRKELRAGDILVEKTPFRLTDKFIPGFWGHAAVWVGTEAELRALGIWDDPIVVKYRDRIREGHVIAEALRTGVALNSLEHFMNIDDLGALRQREISDSERAAVIIRALRQIGKGYNFNFDVESTDKVVCSGLVYLAYAKLPWRSSTTLGRVTFSPDNVAENALAGGPLDVVVLVNDGTWVEGDRLKTMTELMRAAGDLQAKN